MDVETKALEIIRNWKLTKVVYGNDTLDKTGELVKSFGTSAIIVIGGGSVKKNGFLDRLIASLKKQGIESILFEGVEPNPSKETVEKIAALWKSSKSEFAIAIGGGSAMDAAKAAALLVTLNETDISPYFGVEMSKDKLAGRKIKPVVCIPTTSGTSAEVTKYSNVTVHSLGVKKLIVDSNIIPPLAIVDPKLTIPCPKDLTVTVGLDTLTHSMEGYLNCVNDPGNEDANERALVSIELIFKYLLRAANNGSDLEAREMMSRACVLGGTVIVFKSTGGPHMNSFSWYDVMPHGQATGIMLPYYIVYYAKNPVVAKKLEPIAKMLNVPVDQHIGKNVAKAILDWYKLLGFKTTLKEFEGFDETQIKKAIIDAAQNEMKLKAMPHPIPNERKDEILSVIVRSAYCGNLDDIERL
jgi:alcohol dehydrogenase class IV